ncbi:TQXA domain-containing protein OS=Streptomyces alboniger OX=132473 GN=CP975_12200 PE=4 SV=1 [Streptomyces alboniger]
MGSGSTEQDAAAATQVAIWRYSDGAHVDAIDPAGREARGPCRRAPGTWRNPRRHCTDPPAVSGRPGALLGPVTVHTNAATVTVTPPADAAASGVRIIGKDGRNVTTAVNGSQLFFEVPEDARRARRT